MEKAQKKITPADYSTPEFEARYTYPGEDLGALWTPEKTAFRVWAPTASAVWVKLYRSGDPHADDLLEQVEMTADIRGTWSAQKNGDLNGVYYTYQAEVDGQTVEACDPYARTTGVNGARAMVIDLASTNPAGWKRDRNPHAGKSITDAVIYELHVRDLSIDESSGIRNAGKFLGVIETGTKSPAGFPTGLDHMKSLGITHLHLLPSYDYGSVDESKPEAAQFNWGYDPVNYNVPEGSYATDAANGAVRVAEMKQMIQGLHENGIAVVLDVVYNHVYNAESFCFNRLVPQYFSRVTDGVYSNGSGCGNDTASERSMVRKYIVDSVKYWADEYHIDGFRFDLVGLIDCETVNAIMEAVHCEHPDVIFYGEGWSMDTAMTKENCPLTTQHNASLVPGFAFFSDTIRDVLKGTVFIDDAPGFVSGAEGLEPLLRQCYLGLPDWCPTPSQSINYASCHDNMTLFDRIVLSTPDASREERIRMNNLAAAIYMTAQGVPFLHAGEELLRSKPLPDGTFDENSFRSPDSVNSIKWNDLEKDEYRRVRDYYRGLIAFRKAHSILRLSSAKEVGETVHPISGLDCGLAAFRLTNKHEDLFVAFNANNSDRKILLPEGSWKVYVDAQRAGTSQLRRVSGMVDVAPISALILVRDNNPKPSKRHISLALGGIAIAAAAATIFRKRKK